LYQGAPLNRRGNGNGRKGMGKGKERRGKGKVEGVTEGRGRKRLRTGMGDLRHHCC